MRMPNHMAKLLLDDGSEVNLTLNFGLLLQVREKEPAAVKRVIEVIGGDKADLYACFDGLYVAHLCACASDGTEPMDREDFNVQAGWNYINAVTIFNELINPNA